MIKIKEPVKKLLKKTDDQNIQVNIEYFEEMKQGDHEWEDKVLHQVIT